MVAAFSGRTCKPLENNPCMCSNFKIGQRVCIVLSSRGRETNIQALGNPTGVPQPNLTRWNRMECHGPEPRPSRIRCSADLGSVANPTFEDRNTLNISTTTKNSDTQQLMIEQGKHS